MPIDRKYGQITMERGKFNEDEPVFVLRAMDWLSVMAISTYLSGCKKADCEESHIGAVEDAMADFLKWQARNLDKVKKPD